MNRREVLAAGIGLGSVALTLGSSVACRAADAPVKAPDRDFTYCPMFPYMFCGSYTIYYAVKNDDMTGCGSQPASLSGPNGMNCGCPTGDCQATRTVDVGGRIREHVVETTLKQSGKKPDTTVGVAEGVTTTKRVVDVKDQGNKHIFYARVHDVVIDKAKLNTAELLLTMTQVQIDDIPGQVEFGVGHQSKKTSEKTPDDARIVSEDIRSCVVESKGKQYLVIKNK